MEPLGKEACGLRIRPAAPRTLGSYLFARVLRKYWAFLSPLLRRGVKAFPSFRDSQELRQPRSSRGNRLIRETSRNTLDEIAAWKCTNFTNFAGDSANRGTGLPLQVHLQAARWDPGQEIRVEPKQASLVLQ